MKLTRVIAQNGVRMLSIACLLAVGCYAGTAAQAGADRNDASAEVVKRGDQQRAKPNQRAFTDRVFGNNYSKYTHLQSFEGKTYITLSATKKDEPLIWSLEHETGRWRVPVQVGHNELPLRDQHGNPSLLVDDEGYIHVWYGAHGPRHTSERVYARSKRPHDISEWIHPDFPTGITYPMPSVMSDGTVYVMYRAGAHAMPGSAAWVLRRSKDHGKTWSKAITVVQRMPRNSTSDMYCVPVKYPGQDKLAIGVSDEYMRDSPSRHSTSHLFLVVYDATDGTLQNVRGKNLAGQGGLSVKQLREHCLVADYEKIGNRNKRISAVPTITADGTVHVLAPNGDPEGFAGKAEEFDEANKASTKETYGGLPRVWHWNGNDWAFADPGIGFTYFCIARDNALVTWSGGEKGGSIRLESKDHGATWQRTARVKLPSDPNRRVASLFHTGPRPPRPEARVIFYERGKGADNRAWLWGDAGVIGPSDRQSKRKATTDVRLMGVPSEIHIRQQ